MKTLAIVTCVLLGMPIQTLAQAKDGRLALKSIAVSGGGPLGNAVLTPFDIVIERWSSAEDEMKLFEAIKEKGQEAALEVLRSFRRVGFANTPGNLGLEFFYAAESRMPDGQRKILVLTDRPIGFREAVNRPRTIKYPFTLIDLQLNAKNEGKGKLYETAQLVWLGKKGGLMVENYTTSIDLTQVKPR